MQLWQYFLLVTAKSLYMFRTLNIRLWHSAVTTDLGHPYLLTHLLTPWRRVLLEKLTGSASSQEIPRLFGTRRFLTVPTSARHLSQSWANSIEPPQFPPTSWRSILILSSHLRLGLPNGLFPSGLPTRTLRTPLVYYTHKMLKCTVKISRVCCYMFRSIWTIFREPMLSLAEVKISWN